MLEGLKAKLAEKCEKPKALGKCYTGIYKLSIFVQHLDFEFDLFGS
jgi:hypothetical protein